MRASQEHEWLLAHAQERVNPRMRNLESSMPGGGFAESAGGDGDSL